jgi:hypothetical protein
MMLCDVVKTDLRVPADRIFDLVIHPHLDRAGFFVQDIERAVYLNKAIR